MNYTSNSPMTFLSCRNIKQILRRPLIYIVLFSHWLPSFWSQHRPISFDWVLVEFNTSINSVSSNKLPLLWVNLSSKFLFNLFRSLLLKFTSANNWFKLSSNAASMNFVFAFLGSVFLTPGPLLAPLHSQYLRLSKFYHFPCRISHKGLRFWCI